MKTIKNIKKGLFEIGQLLAQNDNLYRLMQCDTADALSQTVGTRTLADMLNNNYIVIYPPVDDSIEEAGRNTYIVLLLNDVSFKAIDENTKTDLTIYVTTDKEHILLNNNKNRMLEMADEVCKTLDGAKISCAGKIEVDNISHIMLSPYRSSYCISCSFVDTQDRKAEI